MTEKRFATLTPLEDALAQLLQSAQTLRQAQSLGLLEACGCILAQDVIAGLDVPGFDNSAMDGYALRCADGVGENTVLPVRGTIAAGDAPFTLEPMSAARIFTGAPIPLGSDTVVMQEDTEIVNECGGGIRLLRTPRQGENIRRRGHDITQGRVVLTCGTRLGPAQIGLAASVGLDKLEVYKPLRVALLATGNELHEPGSVAPDALPAGGIFNSNRYFLRLMLQQLGLQVTDGGIVPDTLEQTQARLQVLSAEHDVILSSGGVSVGEADFVKTALENLGTLQLWKLAIKPGKPFVYGYIPQKLEGRDDAGRCHFLGLPGNPVASYVTFLMLARPFLMRLQGAIQNPETTSLLVPADFDFAADRRRQFLRVRLENSGCLSLYSDQNSSVLSSVAWATGLADIPIGQAVQRGGLVRYVPFAMECL
jgi:molybdopterin molybdotransferase